MAVDKETQDRFGEVMREAMKKQFYRGMSVGAQSICKVVLDLLNDTSLPLMKRIDVVKKYCGKSLKNGKFVFGEEDKNTNDAPETIEEKKDEE